MKIPHSLFNDDEEDNTICLFCRSDDKESIAQYLEKNPIRALTKVISINEAKKHYKDIKDKKALLKEHTHFVCDSRVANQLYNILGSTFSVRNDHPVQINFTNPAQLPGLVQKVIDSTYFHMKGKNLAIRLGHTGMKPAEVVANLLEGLPFAVEKLQNAWKDVHSVHLKTNDSAALPIYTHDKSEMMEYVAQQAAAIPSNSANTSATPAKGKKDVATAEASGKKRKADAVPEEAPAAPASTKKTAAAAEAPKSAAKKAKVEAPAPKSAAKAGKATKAAEAEEPVEATKEAPAKEAPKSAAKGKKPAAKVTVPEPESESEGDSEDDAPAAAQPKGAARTKKPAAKVTPPEGTAVEATPRKSTRRASVASTAAATTPAARAAPKRAASARK